MSYRAKHSKEPSEDRQSSPNGETLRELATKKLHGKDANPSQLGDPISLKAESSSTIPTDEQSGSSSSNRPPSEDKETSATDGGKPGGKEDANNNDNGNKDETLREKAVKDLHGDSGNPSMLGDPTSLKAETSDTVPTEGAEGSRGSKRSSKL